MRCRIKKINEKVRREGRLNAHHRKMVKRRHSLYQVPPEVLQDIRRITARNRIFNQLCKLSSYKEHATEIDVTGEYGLEEKSHLDQFVELSSQFGKFNSKKLTINFSKCTRIWPSGIALICSLWQWVELSSKPKRKPLICQIASSSVRVNSYMKHCGLYEYVKIDKLEDTSYYDNSDVVKIEKEKDKSLIEDKEDEIINLVENHTSYSADDIERFDSIILTETLNNVCEHGISHKDKGWWLLAQYHKKHKIISLCIADNGIGFRHNLMTGPQSNEIKKILENKKENDAKFIEKAMNTNVSGAITASTPEQAIVWGRRYGRGARRGNGLNRICDCCKRLGIELTILSHCGCVSFDSSGKTIFLRSLPHRIIAGTMYHFTIPAK